MPHTIKLTVTQELKDALRAGWTAEIGEDGEGWDPADVQRDIDKMETVPVGTVITFRDDDDMSHEDPNWDESMCTPEEIIILGWDYFGYPSHVAPVEWIAD